MYVIANKTPWSRIGLWLAVGSTAATVLFSLVRIWAGYAQSGMPLAAVVIGQLSSDLRYLAVQLIYVGALVFVGGKFIETRTLLSVGFDRLDAGKVSVKGPDDDNIVWIGHRYANRLEAEAVAAAFQERLKPEG